MTTASIKKLALITLPAGVALFVLGIFVDPRVDESSLTTYFNGLAEGNAADRYQVSAYILHVAYLLWVPGVIALWALARPGVVRTAFVVLGVVAVATLSGLIVTDYYDIALAKSIPAGEAAHVSDMAAHLTGAQLLIVPSQIGLLVAPIVLGISAFRYRKVGVPAVA